jgi:hypothetical protein
MQGKYRHRSKYSYLEFYKFYLAQIERGTMYDMSRELYKKILDRGHELLFDELLKNKRVRFYPNLGDFEVVKYKPTIKYRLPVDWGHWQKTGGKNGGEIRYKLNQHSGGYRYFVRWQKPQTSLHNAVRYIFIMQDPFKKKLTHAIYDGLDAMVWQQHSRFPGGKKAYKEKLANRKWVPKERVEKLKLVQ